jgi:hypothetical protein
MIAVGDNTATATATASTAIPDPRSLAPPVRVRPYQAAARARTISPGGTAK